MEITYEIIPEDITYYSKEAVKGTSTYTFNVIFMSVLVVLFMLSDMLLAVVAVFKNDGSIKIDSINILPRLLIALVILTIYHMALMTLSKRAARKAASNVTGKNGVFCEHTIKLTSDGFTETTHVNQNFASWEGVEKITETPNYVAITYRLGSSHFIPKRAFANAADIKAFVDTAQTYLDEANIPPPPRFD